MKHAVNQPYQSPRQRLWVEIRKNSEGFTIAKVAAELRLKKLWIKVYINGFVSVKRLPMIQLKKKNGLKVFTVSTVMQLKKN